MSIQSIQSNNFVVQGVSILNSNFGEVPVNWQLLPSGIFRITKQNGQHVDVNFAQFFVMVADVIGNLLPDLATTAGILPIATLEQVAAGLNNQSIITPALLKYVIDNLEIEGGGNSGGSNELDGDVMNMATSLLQLVGFAPEDIPQSTGGNGSTVITETEPLPSQANFGPLLIWENSQKRTVSNEQLEARLKAGWKVLPLGDYAFAPNGARFFEVATLPPSAPTTYDDLFVELIGGGWEYGQKGRVTMQCTNRNGFWQQHEIKGPILGVSLAAYTLPDGTTKVFVNYWGVFCQAAVRVYTLQTVFNPSLTAVAEPQGNSRINTRYTTQSKPVTHFDGGVIHSWYQQYIHDMTTTDGLTVKDLQQAPPQSPFAAWSPEGVAAKLSDQQIIDRLLALGFQRTATNLAPVLSNLPTNQTGTVGQAFGYNTEATFSDPESGTLTYSALGLPPGLSINNSGNITGTPTVSGVFTVTLKATDPANNSTSTQFVITINPATTGNLVPALEMTIDVTVGVERVIELPPFTGASGIVYSMPDETSQVALNESTRILTINVSSAGTSHYSYIGTAGGQSLATPIHVVATAQPLAVIQPDYNCQTGALKFKTTGGNGSLIEFSAVGITDWTTNPNQAIEAGLRNNQNAQPIALKARQSGVVKEFVFDFNAFCNTGGVVTPPDTPNPAIVKVNGRFFKGTLVNNTITGTGGGWQCWYQQFKGLNLPVGAKPQSGLFLYGAGGDYTEILWLDMVARNESEFTHVRGTQFGPQYAGSFLDFYVRVVDASNTVIVPAVKLYTRDLGLESDTGFIQLYPGVITNNSDIATTRPSVGNPDPLNPIFVPAFNWVTGPDGQQWLQISNSVNPPASFGWKYTVNGQAEPGLPTLPQYTWAFVEMFDSPGYDPQASIVGGKAQLRIYIGDPSGQIITQNT